LVEVSDIESRMSSSVEQSTVVVTGGTRGLGRELALHFARHRYRVLSLFRGDAQAAASLEAEFAAEGLNARTFQHDVTRSGDESKVWAQPEIAGSTALILIHNASASFAPKPLHLLSWEEFSSALDVSLKGYWLCKRGVLRQMVRHGSGTIVSVATAALAQPPKGFAAYLAAKGAMRALTESVAAEYRSRGIRVFSVSPGFMNTALTGAWHPSMREAVARAGGVSEPARVAERIRQLVEDSSIPAAGEDHFV
jgi:3-oxoacyl-[acyl-carrier protein] reductase